MNFDILALFAVLTLIVLSFAPETILTSGIGEYDVVLHGFAYALVCACAVIRRRYVWSALLAFATVLLVGTLVEFTQPIFGRGAELRDLFANVIGSTFGLAAVLAYKYATDPEWRPRSTDVTKSD